MHRYKEFGCCTCTLLSQKKGERQTSYTSKKMFEEVRKNATGALDRAKLVFNRGDSESVEEQSQPDRLDELSDLCPQLSFQQRLIGFAASFTLGYLIAFMSFRFFIRLIEGNPVSVLLLLVLDCACGLYTLWQSDNNENDYIHLLQ